ncbi:hypothetical protein Calab_1432 [Caldithrix abyssi DSM 13497]|uniref:Uncharacterized protein n=1 Tax=Caldithrix abyssi DSM 13497 TaxID=880073 RepID=H1XPS7_CALAY|nr:hypothetical protein Calab_1432 [Caldithrix abyssi DSM 13497]
MRVLKSLLCERTKSFKSVQKNIQSDNWQSPLTCRRGIADEISKAVTKINHNAGKVIFSQITSIIVENV